MADVEIQEKEEEGRKAGEDVKEGQKEAGEGKPEESARFLSSGGSTRELLSRASTPDRRSRRFIRNTASFFGV